jgi:kynureninase
MNSDYTNGMGYAKNMDEQDVLRSYKSRFDIKENQIYMDGNSLGLSSIDAKEALDEAYEAWKNEGIQIWGTENGKYFKYSQTIAEQIAPLIHSDVDEIAVMGSITTNIHQALSTFYKPDASRYKIIVDELNFPTDIYAVKSIIALKGMNEEDVLVKIKSEDGRTLSEDAIIAAMSEEVALILLPSVLYRSSQLIDMKRVTDAAHDKGILIGWDLAHSIGAVPHDFKSLEPDFAVWCSYKYLNGGPGATAGMYINKKHFGISTGLKGWFGNKDSSQFAMDHNFDQDLTAGGLLQGTPNIFSMAPLLGSLKPFNEAGMQALRKKSLELTGYMMFLIDERLSAYGFAIGSPREDDRRGGHVALEHDEAYRISLAMRDFGVIPDYREPNVIRLAPVPLYIGYEDTYRVIESIERIMKEKIYETYALDRVTVL